MILTTLLFFQLIWHRIYTWVNYDIPSEFKIEKPDKSRYEVARLNYKDELLVTISDNTDNLLSPRTGKFIDELKLTFMFNYFSIFHPIQKTNEKEQTSKLIQGNLYLFQTFDYIDNGSRFYCEYGTLFNKINDIIHELIITGLKEFQEEHIPLINRFLFKLA